MEWVFVAVILASGLALWLNQRRSTQARELAATEALGQVTRVADEDVTRFGEELTALHVDTMTDTLDAAATQDYQRALDAYENAKSLLADARTPDDVSHVTRTLEDGRYALACVRARVAGDPLPQRRPPCFFNPAHGPAQLEVSWAPVGGAPREVPVCLADADRLAQGAEPDIRQVRRGNAMVPWYQGGSAYAPYAHGYYGAWALNGLFPGIVLGSMMSGGWGWDGPAYDSDHGGDYSDGGGSDGDYSGGDYSGGDYSDGGGFDGGGFDGGGFDGF